MRWLWALALWGCEAPSVRDAGPASARPTEMDSDSDSDSESDSATATAAATPTKGKGTVRGRIAFRGKVPAPAKVVIQGADATKCARARDYYAHEVVVGPEGGLSETLVAIQGLAKPDGWAPREVEVEVGDCAFRPRVVHATAGDSLVIENHDTISVLPLVPDRSTPFQAAVLPGQRHPRELPRPGGFRMSDSLGHEWMYAHILVLTHPFHAVTGETGAFEFRDIPEGAYRLNLWHPTLGEKGEPFSVRAEETTTIDVVYEPHAPTKAPAKAPTQAPAKAPPGPQ